MAILNLALVRKVDWEEHCIHVGTVLEEKEQKKAESKWLYRSEMIRKLGRKTATRFIKSKKWEKGEDSDGESMYKKVQKSEISSQTLANKMSLQTNAQLDEGDFKTLQDEMRSHFSNSKQVTKGQPNQQVGGKKQKPSGGFQNLSGGLADRARLRSEALKNKEGGSQASATGKKDRTGSSQGASEGFGKKRTARNDENLEEIMKGIEPPDDPDSKSNEVEAQNRIKKATTKLQNKLADTIVIIDGIGRAQTPIAKTVKQQAQEVKVKANAHIRILNKLVCMPLEKIKLDDCKHANNVASDLIDQMNHVKTCAKPHIAAPSVAGSEKGGSSNKAEKKAARTHEKGQAHGQRGRSLQVLHFVCAIMLAFVL